MQKEKQTKEDVVIDSLRLTVNGRDAAIWQFQRLTGKMSTAH